MRISYRSVVEGSAVPKWYGLAYREDFSMTMIFYPIPINWIVAYSREFYLFLMRGPKLISQKQQEAIYKIGYEKGKEDGQLMTSNAFIKAFKDSEAKASQ